MAKQMLKERQDLTGLYCLNGESGKMVVDRLHECFTFCKKKSVRY